MIKRTKYISEAPSVTPNMPKSARKSLFAQNLRRLMVEKGWNQSELARRASDHLPRKRTMSRDLVSKYCNGVSVPNSIYLKALADALGVEPGVLVPALATENPRFPAFAMQVMPDGNYFLQINQKVPPNLALDIIKLLRTKEPTT